MATNVEPGPRIVAIGASETGLPALFELFERIPVGTGQAFAVAIHRSATHPALDRELAARTRMTVRAVRDAEPVRADHVYVAELGSDLEFSDGRVSASPRAERSSTPTTIDHLFRGLAEERGSDLTCVLLAGTRADGTIGVKLVNERGGLTLAQTEASETGVASVDLVLSIAGIAAKLAEAATTPPLPEVDGDGTFRDILALLRVRTGHDFTHYKRGTLLRRITRRLHVTGCGDLDTYLRHLRREPSEISALLRDFMISVTNFFRGAEAFDALKRTVLPQLFHGRSASEAVRVWVPGCATGEEVYSLAMLLSEVRDELDHRAPIQLFATDIDEGALAEARVGRYPETIVADVSAERLEHFFTRDGSWFQIRKEIRELVLFAPHNILRDAPFSRLDLVSCHNLLIYLDRAMQVRVLEVAHFALRPDRFLFLGTSETADAAPDLFAAIDPRHRIYVRSATKDAVLPSVSVAPRWPAPGLAQGDARAPSAAPPGEAHHRMVERHAPPSVLVNANLDIVHTSRRAARYLTFSAGEPTSALFQCVRPELQLELRASVVAARKHPNLGVAATIRTSIDGVDRAIRTSVTYDDKELDGPMFLVLFEEIEPASPEQPTPVVLGAAMEPVVQQLESELRTNREQLRTTVEQYETLVEEMSASNEELQAINEELRAVSEEVETSREETDSVNQELTAVNEELKAKILEVDRAKSDIVNLMASTDIAVLFLDRDLHIQRFTPRARDLFRIIDSDVGRPLADLARRLDYPNLDVDARSVLESLQPIAREVRAGASSFLARLQPYRSLDDRIAGLVVTFVDVSAMRRIEGTLREREAALQLAERAADAGLWEIDGRVVRLSERGHALFGMLAAGELDVDDWLLHVYEPDRAQLGEALARAQRGVGDLSLEVRTAHPDGDRWLWMLGRRTGDEPSSIVHGITLDITARRAAEAALRLNEQRLRLAIRIAPVVLLTQDLDLRYTWGYFLGRDIDFIGEQDGAIFPADEAAALIEHKRAVLHDGRPYRGAAHLTLLGTPYHFDVGIEALRDRDGRIIGLASALVDVTASKRVQHELELADLRKDQFLATLAHELRNPLTPLAAALDILKLSDNDPGHLELARGLMERQISQLLRLVDDLLDVSRVNVGKLRLRIAPLDLGAVIEAACEAVRSTVADARHELVVHVAGPIEIDGDAARLAQVFTNLLSNATKYTPERVGRIELTAEVIGDRARVTVADNGIGIAPEMLPRVFDLFAQAESLLTRSRGGLGIGLNLVRRLVELHGGTVSAHSEGLGRGSHFVVELPIRQPRRA